MTVPCLAAPAPAGDLEAAVDELRARGLRLSASRRLVLEALFAAGRPGHRRGDRRRGCTGACRAATSPASTATSRRSRSSASCATCTSATARASTRRRRDEDEYVACERCGRSEAVARDVLRRRPRGACAKPSATSRASATSR